MDNQPVAEAGDGAKWIFMVIAALVGVFGLIMASRSADTGTYVAGLIFFLFAVVYNFVMVKRMFDAPPPPPTEP